FLHEQRIKKTGVVFIFTKTFTQPAGGGFRALGVECALEVIEEYGVHDAASSPSGGVRFSRAGNSMVAFSFVSLFAVSPPVASTKRSPSRTALMFVTGLRSAVNRAFVNGVHLPSLLLPQPLPKWAERTFVAETRSRLKSSMNE